MARITKATALPVPGIEAPRKLVVPRLNESFLDNDLRVIAVRKKGVPLVQVRLVLNAALARLTPTDQARQAVLGATLLSGTAQRSMVQIAEFGQLIGGWLSASVDEESVSFSGSCLVGHLHDLLDLVGEVLREASFPVCEIETERTRLAQELAMAASQPALQARLHLDRRLLGSHPYGAGLPEVAKVAKVDRSALLAYLAKRVGPKGGFLVVVGDVSPAKVVKAAAEALGEWQPQSTRSEKLPALPCIQPGPVELWHRPGSQQTNIRIGGTAFGRGEAEAAAQAVALTILGGSFTSRLTSNLREDKGYAYSPHAGIDHNVAGSLLNITADVGVEHTAAAMVEILHELGRMATQPVKEAELEAARRYVAGVTAMAVQTQAGLASYLSSLASQGLGIDHLASLPKRVAAVTTDDVAQISALLLAPARLVTVMVGDADVVADSLAGVTPLTVHP